MRRYFLVLLAGFCAQAAQATPTVKIERDSQGLWVARISEAGTARVTVAVSSSDPSVPPLLGTLEQQGNDQIFRPRFPFQPGLEYRVTVASIPPIRLDFSIPAPPTVTTRIAAVYPTGDLLPENQLKFYIHFTSPMARGDAYRWIALLDAQGRKIDVPFLELGEELWNADNTRLTLYFDPGRVKSDLLPGREMGAPLRAGNSYTLRIDPSWPDANGNKLAAQFQKPFRVGPADHVPPDPKRWRIRAPGANSKNGLVVEFPESLDHALLFRMIDVVDAKGQRVDGDITVDEAEKRWTFTPRLPWHGQYSLRAQTALEDLAGNKLNRPFEFEGTRTAQERAGADFIVLPFTAN